MVSSAEVENGQAGSQRWDDSSCPKPRPPSVSWRGPSRVGRLAARGELGHSRGWVCDIGGHESDPAKPAAGISQRLRADPRLVRKDRYVWGAVLFRTTAYCAAKRVPASPRAAQMIGILGTGGGRQRQSSICKKSPFKSERPASRGGGSREGPTVCRLPAGASRIRTRGPTLMASSDRAP
jgi:hypothetical protein